MNPAIFLWGVPSVAREGLKSFLQNQDCDVVATADVESTAAHCRQVQPDLVLLYDTLPDISSFTLCRRLRSDPLNVLTQVVMLKPSPDQWDIHRGREAGASDIWAAPSSHWDALQRIQTLLRLKAYMDEQARSVLFSLARGVSSRQNLRNGHSDLLPTYAEQLGRSIGLDDESLRELRIACWLHDVGKIAVPDSILLKPGTLDARE